MMVIDCVVIGGGPAGLMAAGCAAQAGCTVVVLEKKPLPARKLLITGKGRCNLTNSAPLRQFCEHIFPDPRFVRPALRGFFNQELIDFFNQLGVPTVEERGGRVFPVSQQAQDVVQALMRWVNQQGVRIETNTAVSDLSVDAGSGQFRLRVSRGLPGVTEAGAGGPVLTAKCCIVATGGLSYPKTGSTGDGYRFARQVGHTVQTPRPALVPIITATERAANMQGIALKNIEASVWYDGKKQQKAFGELLFTHFGLSGPTILTLSRCMVAALDRGQSVSVEVDLKPALDDKTLDARLVRDCEASPGKTIANVLPGLMPRGMVATCLEMTGVAADRRCGELGAPERKQLRKWLKHLLFEVARYCPIQEAIVTAGGITRPEIDPETMASKTVKGLYFAGEVLDVDADTGGYNLQIAFSTGRLAGQSASRLFSLS